MNAQAGAAFLGLIVGWLAATGNKTQTVRMLDVLVVGPLLFAASFQRAKPSFALAFISGATVSYNLRNFLANREQ